MVDGNDRIHLQTRITPNDFTNAFVAILVLADVTSVTPRQRDTARALMAVVDRIDELITSHLDAGQPITDVRNWIETANRLRLSPTGSVVNWERAFGMARCAFPVFTGTQETCFGFVGDKARAKDEISRLDRDDASFVRELAAAFLEKVGRA